jgi:hypothetical protein
VDSGPEGVDSGLEGVKSGSQGLESGPQGVDSGPQGPYRVRGTHPFAHREGFCLVPA